MRARDHFLEYRLIRGIDIGSMSGTMFVGHAFSIIPSAMVALTRIATMIALIGWRLEEDGNPLLVSLAIFEQTVAMLDEVVRAYILWHRKEAAWLTAVLFGVDHPGHVTLAPKSAATGWTLFAPRQHFEWHAGSEAPQTIVFGDGDEHHISLNDVGGSGGHTGLM
jgi:hypothetical protein